jgi:hypothetical protein
MKHNVMAQWSRQTVMINVHMNRIVNFTGLLGLCCQIYFLWLISHKQVTAGAWQKLQFISNPSLFHHYYIS